LFGDAEHPPPAQKIIRVKNCHIPEGAAPNALHFAFSICKLQGDFEARAHFAVNGKFLYDIGFIVLKIFMIHYSKMAHHMLIVMTKPNFFIIFLSCSQGGARATLHPPKNPIRN
jgi:hypothetical protein